MRQLGSLVVNCMQLDAVAAIAVTCGGSLSLANLTVPAGALASAMLALAGASSRLALKVVTIVEHTEWGAQTGTVTKPGEEFVCDPPTVLVGMSRVEVT